MPQEKGSSIGFAMFSGFCIFFGNLAEQYALALAGVTIAVPMFSSCIVVLGEPAMSGTFPHLHLHNRSASTQQLPSPRVFWKEPGPEHAYPAGRTRLEVTRQDAIDCCSCWCVYKHGCIGTRGAQL